MLIKRGRADKFIRRWRKSPRNRKDCSERPFRLTSLNHSRATSQQGPRSVKSLTPPGVSSATTLAGSEEEFFSARTYSGWVRGSMRAVASRRDAATLFGSSISEPTDELIHVVRSAFSPRLTSRYISVFSDGNRYVVDAICARYGVVPESVVTSTGVTGALSAIVKALIAPGDQVLVERPGFDLLALIAQDAGANVEYVDRLPPHFKFDLDKIRQRISATTRLMIITNLHNPTGSLLEPNEIRAIAAELARVNALLVVDEVYADFARTELAAPAATYGDNIISTNSVTKVFGLHALKCGWLIASPTLVERLQDDSTERYSGISKLSHAVAAHVLESADRFDAHWKTILEASRPVLQHHVGVMKADGLLEGPIPRYGCMYFPQVLGVSDTLDLAKWLWQRHGILVAPGEYFGSAGSIRIGFGGPATELDNGLSRLHRALKAWRLR
jgi:aspartate/methionine/tyrosine aminotransferase